MNELCTQWRGLRHMLSSSLYVSFYLWDVGKVITGIAKAGWNFWLGLHYLWSICYLWEINKGVEYLQVTLWGPVRLWTQRAISLPKKGLNRYEDLLYVSSACCPIFLPVWYNYHFSVLFLIIFRNSVSMSCETSICIWLFFSIYACLLYVHFKELTLNSNMNSRKWPDRKVLSDPGQISPFPFFFLPVYKQEICVNHLLGLFYVNLEDPAGVKGPLCSMHWGYLQRGSDV